MTLDFKRVAVFGLDKLRKLSQPHAARKNQTKRRTARIVTGLRDSGKAERVGAYSYSVLADLLNKSNVESLPEWRYADRNKTTMYQLAMGLIEAEQHESNSDKDRLRLIPFVFNLSDSIQQRMLNNKRNEVAECMAILSRDLTNRLKRNVDLWFQLEMAPTAARGKPHIQGALLLAESELKKARQVFHAANGHVSLSFKNRALMFCIKGRQSVATKNGLLYADINWSLYCAKETARTKILYSDQNQPMLTNVVAASRDIKKAAKHLYESLRASQALQAA